MSREVRGISGKTLAEVYALKGSRVDRSALNGVRVTTTYEGTIEAVNALAAAAGADQTLTIDDSDAPLYRLIVSTPDNAATGGSSDIVDAWELLGNQLQKDIYEHHKALAITDVNLTAVKEAIQNPASGAPVLTTDGSEADATSLYGLLLKGTTNYAVSQYVLRKTSVVGSRYVLALAHTNVFKLYTAAQMGAELGTPGAIDFSISVIPAPTPRTGYTWSWLKQTPTVQQLPSGRWQVTQEYWLEQWSTWIYVAVV